ncbi:hypothetical protein SeLEV6574_g07420 [Synchytrium endobioticum]|uniref:Uncharacterized protein n=1 Tax=Synchytrium endobioticum TaxID=286115 RepID=A0A507CDI2_9FUNG|nr:hypothetical protein SeLEV6574_g07420 [Synchytrium endobioticum]
MDVQSTVIGLLFGFITAFALVIFLQNHSPTTSSDAAASNPQRNSKKNKKPRTSDSNIPKPCRPEDPVEQVHGTRPHEPPAPQTSSYADIAKHEDAGDGSTATASSELKSYSDASKLGDKKPAHQSQTTVSHHHNHYDGEDGEPKTTHAPKILRIVPPTSSKSKPSSSRKLNSQQELSKKQRENQHKKEVEKQQKAEALALQELRLKQHRAEQEQIRNDTIRRQLLQAQQERLLRKGAMLESQR